MITISFHLKNAVVVDAVLLLASDLLLNFHWFVHFLVTNC